MAASQKGLDSIEFITYLLTYLLTYLAKRPEFLPEIIFIILDLYK
jgi:hypothetical protein